MLTRCPFPKGPEDAEAPTLGSIRFVTQGHAKIVYLGPIAPPRDQLAVDSYSEDLGDPESHVESLATMADLENFAEWAPGVRSRRQRD